MRTDPIQHNLVRQRHPLQLAEALTQLRNGKSIHKHAYPESLTYRYDYMYGIGGEDDGKVVVSLYANIGRWWTWVHIEGKVPPEVRKPWLKWKTARNQLWGAK